MSFHVNSSEKESKLYEFAADVVKKMKGGTVGFKYAFNTTKIDNKLMRPVYGIGAKAVQYWDACDEILEKSGILKEYPNVDKELFRVILVDLLWGRKKIFGKGFACSAIRKKRKELLLLLDHGSESRGSQMPVFYARVNTLKSSIKSCLVDLERLGYTLQGTPSSYKKYRKAVNSLEEDKFMADYHFNDLFCFHIKAKPSIVASSLIQDNDMVIQNKSSLIPVNLMDIKPGDTVLDMCAAPGMKTAIIAAQLKGKGMLYAVDKDKPRFKEMLKNLKQIGVTDDNVKYVNNDVLQLQSDSESVDSILLDAPCSGSGISTRLGNTNNDPNRLRKLQWIQMKLLTNALTAYPNAKRVVYSTCSLYTEENEEVIDEVMERNKDNLTYKLVDCHDLIKGFSQGSSEFKSGPFCLRVSTEKDLTNGFFVAVFDKIGSSVSEQDANNVEPEEIIPEREHITKKTDKKRKHSKLKNTDEETEIQIKPKKKKKSLSLDKPEEVISQEQEDKDIIPDKKLKSKHKAKKRKHSKQNSAEIENQVKPEKMKENPDESNFSQSSVKHKPKKSKKGNAVVQNSLGQLSFEVKPKKKKKVKNSEKNLSQKELDSSPSAKVVSISHSQSNKKKKKKLIGKN